MKTFIFAYSRRGMLTAGRVLRLLPEGENRAFAPERIADAAFDPVPVPSDDFYGEAFRRADALVFVGACGIAVRKIAPHIRSKTSDPAVICIDEKGQYVIPILSGHIGGANQLARKLAASLNAVPVITTATDIRGRFSVDAWAAENHFFIDSMETAKEVSAAILERDIPLCSMLPLASQLPEGVFSGSEGELGIFIGWEKRCPFSKTLRLIPPVLHLGIGCRKGTEGDAIAAAVSSVLEQANIDRRAVKCAASIDLKADEAGLLKFCEEAEIPVSFYSSRELMEVQGDFARSDFVREITGADNVCERAAMIGADIMILRKTVCSGITIALAAEMKEVRFE